MDEQLSGSAPWNSSMSMSMDEDSVKVKRGVPDEEVCSSVEALGA